MGTSSGVSIMKEIIRVSAWLFLYFKEHNRSGYTKEKRRY